MKIFTTIFLFLLPLLACAQENIGSLKQKLRKIELQPTWSIVEDSNRLVFVLTDTMALCQYDISPLRYFDDTLTLSTFKFELSFEEKWTKKRLKRTTKKNQELIQIIQKRIIAYGDSLNWSGVKTNKQWVLENPMRYFYIVRNWTAEEKEILHQIIRLPNSVVDEVGVFVWLNTLCVTPSKKNQLIETFYSQLNALGIQTSNLGWANERY